jgi:hemerythrin-like domain-containing protein
MKIVAVFLITLILSGCASLDLMDEDYDGIFNMLNVINNVIIKIYYTGEESYKLVNLNIPHSIGRPEFKDIFEYHIKNENTEIYYSGKTSLGRQIEKFCKYKDKFKFRYVN